MAQHLQAPRPFKDRPGHDSVSATFPFALHHAAIHPSPAFPCHDAFVRPSVGFAVPHGYHNALGLSLSRKAAEKGPPTSHFHVPQPPLLVRNCSRRLQACRISLWELQGPACFTSSRASGNVRQGGKCRGVCSALPLWRKNGLHGQGSGCGSGRAIHHGRRLLPSTHSGTRDTTPHEALHQSAKPLHARAPSAQQPANNQAGPSWQRTAAEHIIVFPPPRRVLPALRSPDERSSNWAIQTGFPMRRARVTQHCRLLNGERVAGSACLSTPRTCTLLHHLQKSSEKVGVEEKGKEKKRKSAPAPNAGEMNQRTCSRTSSAVAHPRKTCHGGASWSSAVSSTMHRQCLALEESPARSVAPLASGDLGATPQV